MFLIICKNLSFCNLFPPQYKVIFFLFVPVIPAMKKTNKIHFKFKKHNMNIAKQDSMIWMYSGFSFGRREWETVGTYVRQFWKRNSKALSNFIRPLDTSTPSPHTKKRTRKDYSYIFILKKHCIWKPIRFLPPSRKKKILATG